MDFNSLPSERAAVVGIISPTAQTAAAHNSGWIDCSQYTRLAAYGATGTLGASATVDGKWQQADDSSGTNSGDITGGSIPQIVKASGDNKQFVANLNCASLTPGKRYARFVLTVATATSDGGVIILGFDPCYPPANDNDLATVVSISSV